LKEYKEKHGLCVVINSFPSNLRDLFGNWLDKTAEHIDAGVKSFYLQPERPNKTEEKILKSSFIDLMTSRFAYENMHILYKNYLKYNIPILEEPPAADSDFYCNTSIYDHLIKEIPEYDLLYIGNCWSFKWSQMGPYVRKLKEVFKDRFKVFGRGWPEGISQGSLGNQMLARYVKNAKISLAFHEPSQVLPFATSGNERIFKQLALGAFVVSDSCATFKYYFEEGKHFIVGKSPHDMVKKVLHFLKYHKEREEIAKQGQSFVLEHHTYANRIKRIFAVLENSKFGVWEYD
jgi:spore maturation protein CgeB